MEKILLINGKIAKMKKGALGVQECTGEEYAGMGEILIKTEKIEEAPEDSAFEGPAVIVEGKIVSDRDSLPMMKVLRGKQRLIIPKANIVMIIEE